MLKKINNDRPKVDTCVFGHGIRCGLKVKVDRECSIHMSAGTAILESGDIVHLEQKQFRYYYYESTHKAVVKECFGIDSFFELVDGTEFVEKEMDDLKQQHPEDIPEEDFFTDKFFGIIFLEASKMPIYILIPKEALAKIKQITPVNENNNKGGIFGKKNTGESISNQDIEAYFNPELNLPKIVLPRFGYHKLALKSKADGLEENNIQNPFAQINNYSDVFFEYKAIIDKYIFLIQDALEALHTHFGPYLSHKEADYLQKYGEVLVKKWQLFCEEGEHLFYVQYFYDWLCNLVKAYDEIVAHLRGFSTLCICMEAQKDCGDLLLLGPIQGGNTTYKTIAFRDTHTAPQSEAHIQEVRFLHWRLLIMIWTFDLPFLGLERVLYSYGFDPGIEEELDSTNYWEWIDSNEDGQVDFEDLPIKVTPTGFPSQPISEQAIPYYYPIDSDSIYSIHQYWDIYKTRMNQIDCLLSYNAHFDDPDFPSTDVRNDSFTQREEIIMPLAFNLKPFEYYKIEGHIGKGIEINPEDEASFYFQYHVKEGETSEAIKQKSLKAYLESYNMNIEVIAVDITKKAVEKLLGLNRQSSVQQAQTLVLIYTSEEEGEQIELQECKKDTTPEVKKNEILGDFWLPYKYSCCKQAQEIEGIKQLTYPSFSPK